MKTKIKNLIKSGELTQQETEIANDLLELFKLSYSISILYSELREDPDNFSYTKYDLDQFLFKYELS